MAEPPDDRTRLGGWRDATGPPLNASGNTVSVRFRLPVKPNWLVAVMVELPLVPACSVKKEGLADTVKSEGACGKVVTATTIFKEWIMFPEVAVTVTL